MENPYHRTSIKPHYLDRSLAQTMCFDIFNILSASRELASEFEMSESGDGDIRTSSNFKLHHLLAESRLSQLLLQLAVFVRTFDDVLSIGEHSEPYAKHSAATQGENYIGTLDGGDLRLREACNKIIHAEDFRPVYDHSVREDNDGVEQRAWYLTDEIELTGTSYGKHWEATLNTSNFLEIVLDRIAFSPAG
ncbi:hypothetical protein [Reyranella massiliensis]|uniref:hypothetical protein n=1 Tax=Reyranella massiliensis TaxID=445220 RepID=UPI0011D19298|nr:hypothetical protein [Reyranella massiliensis]